MRKLRLLAAVFGLTASLGSALQAPSGAAFTRARSGTLNLKATIHVISNPGLCDAPGAYICAPRSGTASVRGLGNVTETYNWSTGLGPPYCDGVLAKPLPTTAKLVVAGKGEIHLALAAGSRCVDLEPVRDEPQEFTIAGGTGRFEGASGYGTVERSITSGRGHETWTGTLVVPGFEFDLTPPTLHGATSKIVRAPDGVTHVRVVTADDAVDGRVHVSCKPSSGSRFRIGRTIVRCSATDTSANTQTAAFKVTVKRKR